MFKLNPNSQFLPENLEVNRFEHIYLVIRGQELLVSEDTKQIVFLSEDELKWSGMDITEKHFLGTIENKSCYVAELSERTITMENTELQNMLSLLGQVRDTVFSICSRAIQLTQWYRLNQYCGKCGAKMIKHATERAMECTSKDNLVYPKIAPCIIVLVTKGEDLLLAHNKNFPGKFYSTLAGFIEAGETAEEAISREIFEEVNINIKDPTYFGSQSWPFPSQLMLGYHAEYSSGEIKPDGQEIDIAQWFHYKSLPQTPSGKISISGRLIESYVDKLLKTELPGFS